MIRLLTWLITGFWPSRASLHALERRIATLELRVATLTKKHNSLAGSYYADSDPMDGPAGSESVSAGALGAAGIEPSASIGEPFPEEEFQRRIAERDARMKGVSHV